MNKIYRVLCTRAIIIPYIGLIVCCLVLLIGCKKKSAGDKSEVASTSSRPRQRFSVIPNSGMKIDRITEESIRSAIGNALMFHDNGAIRIAFEKNKEQTLRKILSIAINDNSSELSTLIGCLLASSGDQSGELWMQENMEGTIKEWAKLGYGIELAKLDLKRFQAYLLRIPDNNTRDNLVVNGIREICRVDKLAGLNLFNEESSNMAAGTSMAIDQAASALLAQFVKDLSQEDLIRWLQSDDFRLVTKGREIAVAEQIAKDYPDLAIQWATEQGFNNEAMGILLPLYLKQAAQKGDSEIVNKSISLFAEFAPATVPAESLVKMLLGDAPLGSESRNMFAKATSWLQSLPDSEISIKAYEVLIREYSSKDLKSAMEWLEAMPPGARKDSAIIGMVESAKGESKSYWLQKISNTEMRMNAINNIKP